MRIPSFPRQQPAPPLALIARDGCRVGQLAEAPQPAETPALAGRRGTYPFRVPRQELELVIAWSAAHEAVDRSILTAWPARYRLDSIVELRDHDCHGDRRHIRLANVGAQGDHGDHRAGDCGSSITRHVSMGATITLPACRPTMTSAGAIVP
jgi:hypothetical protein